MGNLNAKLDLEIEIKEKMQKMQNLKRNAQHLKRIKSFLGS